MQGGIKGFISFAFWVIALFAMKAKDEIRVVSLDYPSSWPKPTYNFKKKPLDPVKIDLGRKLFYDPILSKDNSISCASCHLSYTAFTHVDHALSHGIGDSIGRRNSPVLINLAWSKLFMWDGAVNHMDVQALAPITNPLEMGEELNHVIEKLRGQAIYRQKFYQAFGDSTITGEHLLLAMAQFQLTLVSDQSKYDEVMRGDALFSDMEKAGFELFNKHCDECHTAPLFTNHSFESNGLAIDSTLNDYGRYEITQNQKDSLKFKVPTLRNIEFSKPYMHDGRFQSLSQVMKFYSSAEKNQQVHPSLENLKLTDNEQREIIAFLKTLTDKKFLFNKEFAYPR